LRNFNFAVVVAPEMGQFSGMFPLAEAQGIHTEEDVFKALQ